MSIRVHPELWTRFPGMKILCVTGEGLDNNRENAGVTTALAKAQEGIVPSDLDHRNLQAWREIYQAAGISMGRYPVSILAMVKRIGKGGRVPSINPLVDFYNSISIKNVTPLGGMDLDQLDDAQQLRLTKEGEQFLAIGAEQAETVQAGEICYSDNTHITTRHFAWRQADQGAIRPGTTRFVLIAEIVPGTEEGLLKSVEKQLISGLKEHFDVQGNVEIIEE
jgi:DNA/RNA-binding domain of Phe-tRNA-synthetase-like protein